MVVIENSDVFLGTLVLNSESEPLKRTTLSILAGLFNINRERKGPKIREKD